MKDQLSHAQKHALLYSYIDGAMEFIFGGICLLLGVYFYAQVLLPPDSLLSRIMSIGLVLIVFGGVFASNKIVRVFKERITYPRTGYVAYRRAYGLSRWARAAIGGGIGMLMSALVTLLFSNYRLGAVWMPAITGIVFGILFLIMAFRTSLLRLYLLAFYAVLLGGGLMIQGIGDIYGLAIFYGGMALALLASGATTLWNYLRQTRPPEETDEP